MTTIAKVALLLHLVDFLEKMPISWLKNVLAVKKVLVTIIALKVVSINSYQLLLKTKIALLVITTLSGMHVII